MRVTRADAETLLDVLLDNVFSHTPEGTVYAVLLDNVLSIEDEGPGFDAAGDVPDPRGKSRSGSTGLGLDIAHQIAGRMGGQLLVGSRGPAGGARVQVRLPH